MNSADRDRATPTVRRSVALVDFALLALIAAASFVYWLVSGHAVYWPTVLFAVWCAVVQFALRRRPNPERHRQRRQRFANAAVGALSALVLIAAVAIPLTKLFPL